MFRKILGYIYPEMNVKNVTKIILLAALLLMAGCLWLGMSFCQPLLAWVIMICVLPASVIAARLQNNYFVDEESVSFFRRVFFVVVGACITSMVGSYFVWHDSKFTTSIAIVSTVLFVTIYIIVHVSIRFVMDSDGLFYTERRYGGFGDVYSGYKNNNLGSIIMNNNPSKKCVSLNSYRGSEEGKQIACNLNVQFRPEAQIKMFTYARRVNHEISGFGKVRFLDDETILVEDVLIHQQSNNPANTDLNEGAALFLNELIGKKEDPRLWRLWWHSHHTMDTQWSWEDCDTIGGFCVQNDASVCDWMLSVLVNIRGSMRVRFDLYKPLRISIDDIPWSLYTEPDSETVKQCDEDIKKFVKTDVLGRLGYAVGGFGSENGDQMSEGFQQVVNSVDNGQKCHVGFCVRDGGYTAEMTKEALNCFKSGKCPVCGGPAKLLKAEKETVAAGERR